MSDDLDLLARRLGDALRHSGSVLATAESCTGGWIAKVLTGIPGSSGWFDRGFVTYSNAAKREMLGVDADLLARWGAVSEQTVRAMAIGALAHSQADFSLSVSGIAGPGGGTPEKPVGSVWFGWSRRDGLTKTRLERLSGDRERVRHQAVAIALQGVLDLLDR